jgi:hypothetical protein
MPAPPGRILVAVRNAILICSAVLALAAPALAGPGDLQLTIGNGRVTLIADNVPIRTILQEWERLGQSKIVNGEKMMGGPVTLRLIDVPEAKALDVVLSSASGYLAAPRVVQMANASQFDRIVVLASSRPTASAPSPTPMAQPQPQQQFPSNPAVTAPAVEEDEDEPEEQPEPPQGQQVPATAMRPGVIQPQPQQQPQQQPPPPPRPIPQ